MLCIFIVLEGTTFYEASETLFTQKLSNYLPSAASRRVLLTFEWYGHPRKLTQKSSIFYERFT